MDNLYNNMMSLEDNQESPDEDISNIFWSMCASCKKIKDRNNNWINLESYLISNKPWHLPGLLRKTLSRYEITIRAHWTHTGFALRVYI